MGMAIPSAFVIMPFGRKNGADGSTIDFDAVYEQYFKPALEAAGLRAHRADAEQRGGSIHADMFQDLLLSEFVLADLTIDNPNVWYEIGVRHALRMGGVVMTYAARERLPFDLAGQRMQRYTLLNGKPDPNLLEAERADLAGAIRATRGTWRGHKASPVYAMMPYLQEPDWRTLKLGEVNEFWQALEFWQSRVEVAQLKQRPGDIVVLADEMPNRILELEALRKAGKALIDLRRSRYALSVLDRALMIDPKDVRCRQLRGIALGRELRFEEAREVLRDLANESRDGETLGLLARSWKDEWIRLWTVDPAFGTDKLAAARNTAATLAQAAEAYVAAFQRNPAAYYPGINALLLITMWEHVTGRSGRFNVALIAGGVRWAVECALALEKNYWLLVTRAEQNLIEGNRDAALCDYGDAAALAVANVRPFDLDSSLQTLAFLRDLGLRPELVAEAIEVMRNAERQLIHRVGPQSVKPAEPTRVILFSGHMVDRPNRPVPRFPEKKAPVAAARIGAELDKFEVRPGDLGISQAASGGDLLFARACLDRGMRLEIYLPQREPEFLASSVSFAAPVWQEWFDGLKDRSDVTFRVMTDEIGPTPEGIDSYSRCNRWMLYSAMSCGLSRVSFLTLWDGQPGDGPGGTDNMVDVVRSLTGRKPVNIDPAAL